MFTSSHHSGHATSFQPRMATIFKSLQMSCIAGTPGNEQAMLPAPSFKSSSTLELKKKKRGKMTK
jgi:hypothetical protein